MLFLVSCQPATEPFQRPPATLPADAPRLSPLLADDLGKPIATREGWDAKRAALKKKWTAFLGEFPSPRSPLSPRVLAREELPAFTREHVEYRIEEGVLIDAYLLVPRNAQSKLPAVVVFHPTVATHARQPAGLDTAKPELFLGVQLAERGYVALCPRCFIFEEGAKYGETALKAIERHPGWKGMTRMAYDGSRAVDFLESLPFVDRSRIGAIGHSLGAKETLYAAALDDRVRAAVFSEGGIGLRFSNWDAIWYLSMAIWDPDLDLEHHHLLALVAPRAFLLLAGESADGDKSWPFIEAVLPVWRLLGAPGNLGWLNHRAGHAYPPAAREAAFEFLDRHLKD